MLQEFKTFIMRGNVIDMAVGIIIGAAFSKIVSILVEGVIMPPIGLLMGGIDFSDLFIDLSGKGHASLKAAEEAGAPVIKYGLFINTVIEFLIVAFAIFILIKFINQLRGPEPADEAPVTKKCPECLSEIPIEAKRCKYCTSLIE